MKKRNKTIDSKLLEKKLQKEIEISMKHNSFSSFTKILNNCLQNQIDITTLIKDRNELKNSFEKLHPVNILPKSDENITISSKKIQTTEQKNENKLEDIQIAEAAKVDNEALKINYNLQSEVLHKKLSNINLGQRNIYLKNELRAYLDLSSFIIFLYQEEIDIFITLEKDFYSALLLSNYSIALDILEKVDKNICYSKWTQFMRLITLKLMKKDNIDDHTYNLSFDNYSDLIESNSSRLSHFIECNLFTNKLNDLDTESTDRVLDNFVSNINNWKDDIGKFDGEAITNFLKEINHGYYEKSIISPFNKISDYKTFSRLINEHINCSIIDVYKIFSSIIIELQITDDSFFKDYIYEDSSIVKRITKLSFKDNIIKINYYKNTSIGLKEFFKSNDNLNLLEIYNEFLKGNFTKVISLSLLGLEKYPFSIDLIYYLVHSLSYNGKSIESFLESTFIKRDSLLYFIIVNYFNLLNNIDIKDSIENLKKILLLFGSYSQWSMYLYYVISNFLCRNSDSRTRKFSDAIIYSYFFHPRVFYSLNESTQKVFISKIDDAYISVKEVFSSYIKSKYTCLDSYVNPAYRGAYINYKNTESTNSDLNIIQNLYMYKDKMPFFYKIKVMNSYLLKLVNDLNFSAALELLIKNYLNYNMPLCVMQYKNFKQEYLFKNCDRLPHYSLLCVLDNPKDTIRIYHTMMRYLQSVNDQCFKPSHLKDYISTEIFEQKVQIRLLKEIMKEEYIEEFLLHIATRIDVYKEQLLILELIKKYDKEYDSNNEKKINLEDKITILSNTTYIIEQKISIDLRKIKLSLSPNFEVLYKSFSEAPKGNEDYQFYKLIKEDESYLNQNKNYSREEKLENIFKKVLNEIIYSNIGVVNSISENILHNYLDDTLRQPLLENHIFLQTNNDKYDDSYWIQNNTISCKLKEFSMKLNKFLEDFKNKIKVYSSNKGDVYFNFSYENIITENRFFTFLDFCEEHMKFNEWTYITFLDEIINYLLFFIKKEITFGSKKIKKDLISKLDLLFSPLEDISNSKFKDHYTHSRDIIYSKSIEAIVSWFKLNETQIYKNFTIQEVINTLKKDYPTLEKIAIKFPSSKKIKGEYFLTFYRIYYLLLDNIIVHSHLDNMKLRINIKEKDSNLIIENFNTFEKNGISCRSNNSGLSFLKQNIEYINADNTFEKRVKNNEFWIILNLIKEDLFNE